MKTSYQLLSLFIFLLFLAACGGGESSGNKNPPNTAPTTSDYQTEVKEDNELKIPTSELIALARDADGDTLSFSTLGKAEYGEVEIVGSDVFYIPNENYNGTDVFSYTVTDNKGGSATGKVSITITAVNDQPIVELSITPTENHQINREIIAKAIDSVPFESGILNYQWELKTPAGSNTSLSSTTTESVKFTPNNAGVYEINVIINDGSLSSEPTSKSITIFAPPIAEAGEDFEAKEGQLVQLSANGSIDTNKVGLNYSWRQISGVSIELYAQNSSSPEFYAPEVFDSTILNFELTVTDTIGYSSIDIVEVLITDVPIDVTWDLGQDLPNTKVECFALSPNTASINKDPNANGEWLQAYRDRKHTRKTELVGDISCPKVKWTIDLGKRKSYVALTPSAESKTETFTIPTSGYSRPYNGNIENDFEVRETYYEARRPNGTTLSISSSEGGRQKVGEFLSEYPGSELLSCDTGLFQVGTGGSDALPCYLLTLGDAGWEKVWETQPLRGFTNSTSTNGQLIVGDFDNDGELEGAALGWYEVYIINMKTGKIEATGVFSQDEERNDGKTTGRAYGWFGARNIDSDPELEFVILGDFEMFVSVLDWQEGQLIEKWDYQIEAGTFINKAKHDTGVNPVVNLDGDNSLEIVTSIFNQNGDEKWHTLVFNSVTGDLKFDLENRHISGTGDLTKNGKDELFLTKTTGHASPKNGPVEILSFTESGFSSIWQSETEGFNWVTLPNFDLLTNSRATHERRTLFFREFNEKMTFSTYRMMSDNNSFIKLYQWVNGKAEQVAVVSGANLSITSFPTNKNELGILIKTIANRADRSNLSISGYIDPSLILSERSRWPDGHQAAYWNLLTASVSAKLNSSSPPLLLTQDFSEYVRAYDVSSGTPVEKWQTKGRGMTNGDARRSVATINGFGSMLIAQGKTEKFLVTATSSNDGLGLLKAIKNDGSLFWKAEFNTPGATPIWNEAGITNWLAGNFTSLEYEDVMVSYRVAKSASDHLTLLNGLTGESIWTIDTGGRYSSFGDIYGAGGSNMPSFDWDGDGSDEVLSTLSSLFSVIDGTTGEILLNRWSFDNDENSLFQYSVLESPAISVIDFDNNGIEELLYTKSDDTLAVLDFNGNVRWKTPFYEGLPQAGLAGVGNFLSKDRQDILVVGQCGKDAEEIRLYNSANGNIEWVLPAPKSCEWPEMNSVATGDINGDGYDEGVFVIQSNLFAVGRDEVGKGQFLWSVDLGDCCEHSYPIIADVTGDGTPTIIVNTANGYVIGIGQ
ncbi:Ig-like domain-containing protein [Pseudoalteromonas sp. SSM20]|uniref:Ig-like domain-containing protein n=1 Tax=Pseudoalteromonas sp. SSM20 TaxID=3139394 RepID=UPI003BAB1DED